MTDLSSTILMCLCRFALRSRLVYCTCGGLTGWGAGGGLPGGPASRSAPAAPPSKSAPCGTRPVTAASRQLVFMLQVCLTTLHAKASKFKVNDHSHWELWSKSVTIATGFIAKLPQTVNKSFETSCSVQNRRQWG
ncbi:unnamed protein product [Colias eurytheme]|nr:unnamed protein product [Colias eurytheme]